MCSVEVRATMRGTMSVERSASGDTSGDKPLDVASRTSPTLETPEQLRAAAEETVRKMAETVRQFPLRGDIEPAFVFKA